MHNHYIINDEFEFHPASNSLRRLSEPENVVVINAPAGRCLLLLIQRQNSVISQQVFMDEVWKKCGMLVSANTYYQNISILRKGLKKVGIEHELIVTIPRLGLTLADDTRIVKEETSQAVTIDHQRAVFIDSQELIEPCYKEMKQSRLKIPSKTYLAMVIACVSTVVMSAMIASWWKIEPKSYYQNFSQEIKKGECHIRLAPDNAVPAKRQSIMEYLTPFINDCDKYPWIYLDSTPFNTRVMILQCPVPVTEHRNCISNFYYEKV